MKMPEEVEGPSTLRKRKSTLGKIGSSLKRSLSKSPKKQPKDQGSQGENQQKPPTGDDDD